MTPIDLRFPFTPYDRDLELKALEHIRVNLFNILPLLPRHTTCVIGMSGAAHNTGPIPLLLLTDPVDDDWDVLDVLDALQAWVDRQEPQALRRAADAAGLPLQFAR